MRKAKRDANHADILRDLRRVFGAAVRDTSALGHSMPDAMVARFGRLVMVEIKAPGGRLTTGQHGFREWCRMYRIPYVEARTSADTIAAVAAVKEFP
jgi:hypothetical protein